MAEYIREVEKIIDAYHKQNPLFSLNRKTALYNALTVFEDACRLGGTTNLALIGDSLEYSMLIREQLDSLNVLIQWIFQDCSHKDTDTLEMKTSVYKGYKQDKIEMRGDRAEMSDFPLYLNTVAGGLDRRDQTIGGFSFVVKIYAVPVVEIIG